MGQRKGWYDQHFHHLSLKTTLRAVPRFRLRIPQPKVQAFAILPLCPSILLFIEYPLCGRDYLKDVLSMGPFFPTLTQISPTQAPSRSITFSRINVNLKSSRLGSIFRAPVTTHGSVVMRMKLGCFYSGTTGLCHTFLSSCDFYWQTVSPNKAAHSMVRQL